MNEIWKPIPGYEGKYDVSNLGRVRSLDRSVWCHGNVKAGHFCKKPGCVLRPAFASTGYPCVVLGRRNTQNLHVLVALTFIGPIPTGCEVRHKDGDRSNPRADNLCYGTRKENIEDSRKHGTFKARYEHCRKIKAPMRELMCRLYSSMAFKQKDLAKLFSTSPENVIKIVGCGV